MEGIMFLFKRSFLNLVLVLTGILTLVTGLFLFFHIKSHFIMHVHELGSLFFAILCLFHLILNWKPLLHSMKGRLSGRSMMALLIFTTLVMAYSGVTADAGKGRDKDRPYGRRHNSAEIFVAPEQGQTAFLAEW